MGNQIDVRIELDEKNLDRDPFFLQDLEKDFSREFSNPILRETRKAPMYSMGPELLVAIELAGLAITALGMIWTVLQIRYRGEITIEKMLEDGTKLTVRKGYLTDAQLRKDLENLEKEAKANKFRKLFIKLTES